jgi:hypothetical protein
MAQKGLICLLILLPLCLGAQSVTIGNGTILHQGLPIEPLARFSYSQQLYLSTEIGQSGSISMIGFQYNVNSTGFFDANRLWRIWLGHSSQSTLEDWVDIGQLSEVYHGLLDLSYFSGGLPGQGWLMIPLQNSFEYSSLHNLILAVDENTDANGSSADDFYCFSTSGTRALQYQSMSINPDPASPPPPNLKTHLSNLSLFFTGTADAPQNLHGYYSDSAVQLSWGEPTNPLLLDYQVNRNGMLLALCSAPPFQDSTVSPGQSYSYNVQARYSDGSVSGPSNTFNITIPQEGTLHLIAQGFESYPAFSQELEAWQNLDLDGSLTWGWEHTDFPCEGEALSWLVFAPAQCTPALTDISAHSGHKMLMATASMNPPNNDWLISPHLHLGNNAALSFWARSYTAAYGLERLRVLISTTDSTPASFTALHPEAYLAVPANWTEYDFDLSAYSNQDIYIAWNCVSLDALALFLDDILLSSEGGHLDTEQALAPMAKVRSYPNPARGSFKLDSAHYFAAGIYNIKGQLLHSVTGTKQFDSAPLPLPAGIYLIRVQDARGSYTLKQVVLP